jgi:hypothetical protein
MKTNLTDSQGVTLNFEFDGSDVVITPDSNHKPMAMPIEQVVRNSEPWKFVKDKYIKMSPDAIVFIEKYCQNIVFS